jgi:hypothetical protein
LEYFVKKKRVDTDRQVIFATNSLRRIRRPKPEGSYVQVILGAIAKLHKAIISFVMSVCLSIRMVQLASYWTDFHEI